MVLRRRLLTTCLDSSSIDQISQLQLAEAIKLGFAPWLAQWLEQGSLVLGTAEQRMLRIAARAVALQARAVREHLGELLAAADNAGVSICLLKGAALEPWVYPGPGYRPMGDIDLLVAEHEQGHFEAILRSKNYVQRSAHPPGYYTDHHHSMPFWHPRYAIWIEVHTRLYPEVANVFRGQQETFDYDGVVTSRLTAPAQILYTVSHWADPFPGPGGLIALIDLGLLLRRYGAPDIQHYHLKPDQREWVQRALETACSLLPQKTGLTPAYAGTRLEETRCHLLRAIARNYVVDGSAYTRWSSSAVIANHWYALMNTTSPALALGRVPWWFLFPPHSTNRFHPGFILQRLSRLWRQDL
jgi:hypothetical protein